MDQAEELTSPSTTASPATQSTKRRKSEVDDRSGQPRAKRARYISIAWSVFSRSIIAELGVESQLNADCKLATNVSVVRSSAMAKRLANVVATWDSNASMRPIAVTISRTPSMSRRIARISIDSY